MQAATGSTDPATLGAALADPVSFIRWAFPCQCDVCRGRCLLSDQQIACIEDMETYPFSLFGKGHSTGGTFTLAAYGLYNVAAYQVCRVLNLGPNFTNVAEVQYPQIHALIQRARVARTYQYPEPNATALRMGPDRGMLGLSTDDRNKLGGHKSDRLVGLVDEAMGMEDWAWDALRGWRASGDVRIGCFFQPWSPTGPLYKMATESEGVHYRALDVMESPNLLGLTVADVVAMGRTGNRELDRRLHPHLVTRRWVYDAWLECDGNEQDPRWLAQVRAQFPKDSEWGLVPLDALTACAKPPGPHDVEDWHVAAIDVAGEGRNETVLGVRRGERVIVSIDAIPGPDPRGECVARLRAIRNLRAVNVDATGIGYNFALHLRDQELPVVMVKPGEASDDPSRWVNRRAQIFWRVREAAMAGQIVGMTDERTRAQLGGLRYGRTPKGAILIESKKLMKASPDRADVVSMLWIGTRLEGAGINEKALDRMLEHYRPARQDSRGLDGGGRMVGGGQGDDAYRLGATSRRDWSQT